MEKLSLKAGEVWKRDDEIVVIKCADQIALHFDDVQEIFDAYLDLTNHTPHKVMIVSGEHGTATREGREHAQKTVLPCLAEAIVVQSFAQRIISNIYIAFKTCAHPIKLFNAEDDAVNWLQNLGDIEFTDDEMDEA